MVLGKILIHQEFKVMSDILAKLEEQIANRTGDSGKEISLSSYFDKDLGMDSFYYTELCMDCEKCFGIEITDYQFVKLYTVADLVTYILTHKSLTEDCKD